MAKCVGAILAGGGSRRLPGKANYVLQGVPIIQRVTNALWPVCHRVFLVVSDQEECPGIQLPRVYDGFPGCGPLGGIHAALKAAREPCLVVACDMPFLKPELLQYMIDQAKGYDAVVPCGAGRFEPLHTLYCPSCLSTIEESLRQGNLKLADLLSRLRLRKITEEEVSRFGDPRLLFFNVNTPQDLQSASQMAHRLPASPCGDVGPVGPID